VNFAYSVTTLDCLKNMIKTNRQDIVLCARLCHSIYHDSDLSHKFKLQKENVRFYKCFNLKSHKHFLVSSGWIKKITVFFRGGFPLTDSQFSFIESKNESGDLRVFIVVKGTQEKEDWLTNFSVNFKGKNLHKGAGYAGRQAIRHLALAPEIQTLNYMSLQKQLKKKLFIEHNVTEIIFTGHSLGGAVALAGALHFFKKINQNIKITVNTFGAPPIFFNEISVPFTVNQFVNRNDPIPFLEKLFKMRHFSTPILLDGPGIDGHSMERYLKNIEGNFFERSVEFRN